MSYYMGNNSPEILESILDEVRRDEDGVSVAVIGYYWCFKVNEVFEIIKRISKSHPEALITIDGSENSVYPVIYYIKNGKSCIAKPIVAWPEFDESKLI
jgi:hypothetical protein